eukprot:2366620-Rhodomonas_salina.1
MSRTTGRMLPADAVVVSHVRHYVPHGKASRRPVTAGHVRTLTPNAMEITSNCASQQGHGGSYTLFALHGTKSTPSEAGRVSSVSRHPTAAVAHRLRLESESCSQLPIQGMLVMGVAWQAMVPTAEQT